VTLKLTRLSLGLIVVLVAVPVAVQAQEGHEVEITAAEDPQLCGDASSCLADVDDTWEVVYAGETLDVTFSNEASQNHSLTIVPEAERNATDREDSAILATGPVEPEASVTETVTVREGTDAVYMFDEDYEDEGMSLVQDVYLADSQYEGEPECENETRQTSEDASDPGPCEDRNNEPSSEIPFPLAGTLAGIGVAVGVRCDP
jgi:hypothetical protein